MAEDIRRFVHKHIWRPDMNFVSRFLHEIGAEMAIEELAERDPQRVRAFAEALRKTGYPNAKSEAEDILLDRFARMYGIPRDERQAVGAGEYRS